MANTTIKITQLQNIGNGLATNTLLPVVNTTSTAITQKVTVGNVANFTLNQAGNLLPAARLANLAYSVVNAAQPNITSVGTLNINTLKISGGTNGYVLQTDGTGNLSWTAGGGGGGNGSPGGSNTQVQFNDDGDFSGSVDFTFDSTSSELSVTNISASDVVIENDLTVSGNIIGAIKISAENIEGNGANLSNISGANVDGEVGFAEVANSVALANVTGIGNIATIDLDGNSANILYGNGVFDSIPNPFNQDLNTTDNVQFDNIISTSAIKFDNSGDIVGAIGYSPTSVNIEGWTGNVVSIITNDLNTWEFGNTGSLTLPVITLGPGIDEQTSISSQRKIIPGERCSAYITGSDPAVVYTASSSSISSLRMSVQIQHVGQGFEFFDVVATSVDVNTYYTVNNRVGPIAITETDVLVDFNGDSQLQVTLTINSGASTSLVTYDSVEFGIPQI